MHYNIIAMTLVFSLVTSTAAATGRDDRGSDTTAVDLAEEDSGVHTHDGFFVRLIGGSMAIGIGTAKENGTEAGIASAGGSFEASVGAIVSENLALHADFLSASGEATWAERSDGVAFGRSQDVDFSGVGLGVTRYFEPSNVYISGSLMSVWLTAPVIDEEGVVEMTDSYGGLLMMRAGKEWWVGDEWGLGIVGSIFAGAAVSDVVDNEETVLGFAGATVGVSATFN